MKLILFSHPDQSLDKIADKILPKNRRNIFGYMPADGSDPKPQYTPFWQDFAKKHNADFVYIDNSKRPSEEELKKFQKINSLMVTGGNSFALLKNIKENGYDKLIETLSQNEDFIYSGFSAGAIIMTPDIRIALKENAWGFGYDENLVNLQDTRALGYVDFEILPHYDAKLDFSHLKLYEKKYRTSVRAITDQEFIIIDK